MLATFAPWNGEREVRTISSRPTSGALEPALTKLIVPGGSVASLAAQINLASRQAGANACAVVAPRVEALRPGLRAQMPVPSAADLRQRSVRPQAQTPAQKPGQQR